MGAPRTHDRTAVMLAVCERIAEGQLVQDAALAEGVEPRTIRKWAIDPEYGPMYARARESQAHALAEEAIAIADGVEEGAEKRIEAMAEALKGVEEAYDKERILNALANAAVQRDRIRVDARKWLVSKIAPRLYGERKEVDITSNGQTLEALVSMSRKPDELASKVFQHLALVESTASQE